MKKLVFFFVVGVALTFMACGSGSTTDSTTDSTTVVTDSLSQQSSGSVDSVAVK
jgi:ABC-type Zn uptake system ZnuABC Zn-binding protein ZnuA